LARYGAIGLGALKRCDYSGGGLNGRSKFANADTGLAPLWRSVTPVRRSVVAFVRNNEDPHIATYKMHQQLEEISFVTPKRLLHNICHLQNQDNDVIFAGSFR
jgi:hypothetical protein